MEKRPVGVTIVGVLILIAGVFYVVGGLISIIGAAADGFTPLIALTVVLLIIGLIYLLVARGIFSGSRGARLIVGIVTVLQMIAQVINLFGSEGIASPIISLIISIVILWILYGSSGKRFFEATA